MVPNLGCVIKRRRGFPSIPRRFHDLLDRLVRGVELGVLDLRVEVGDVSPVVLVPVQLHIVLLSWWGTGLREERRKKKRKHL